MAATKDIAPVFAKAMEEYTNKGNTPSMVCESHPFLDWVFSNALNKTATGKKFKHRVRTGRNDTFTGYGPYETKKFEPTKGWHEIEWEMREHRATAQICLQEVEYASAEGTFGAIMKEKYDEMVSGMRITMSKLFHTGMGDDKTAQGIGALIGDRFTVMNDNNGNPITTFGGLSREDFPFLQSIIKRPGWSFPEFTLDRPMKAWTYTKSTATLAVDGTPTGALGSNLAGANMLAVVPNPYTGVAVNPADETTWWQPMSLALVRRTLTELSKCTGTWNGIMLMHPDLYDEMLALMEAAGCCENVGVRLQGDKLVQSKRSFVFEGVSGLADYDCPKGIIRFITTEDDAFKVRVLPSQWMRGSSSWMEPYDQNAMYNSLQAWFQSYSENPRMLAQLERVAHRPAVI